MNTLKESYPHITSLEEIDSLEKEDLLKIVIDCRLGPSNLAIAEKITRIKSLYLHETTGACLAQVIEDYRKKKKDQKDNADKETARKAVRTAEDKEVLLNLEKKKFGKKEKKNKKKHSNKDFKVHEDPKTQETKESPPQPEHQKTQVQTTTTTKTKKKLEESNVAANASKNSEETEDNSNKENQPPDASQRKSSRAKKSVQSNDVTEFVEILDDLQNSKKSHSKKESIVKEEKNEQTKIEKELKKKEKELKKKEKTLKILNDELLNVKAQLVQEQKRSQRLANECDALTKEVEKLSTTNDVLLEKITKRGSNNVPATGVAALTTAAQVISPKSRKGFGSARIQEVPFLVSTDKVQKNINLNAQEIADAFHVEAADVLIDMKAIRNVTDVEAMKNFFQHITRERTRHWKVVPYPGQDWKEELKHFFKYVRKISNKGITKESISNAWSKHHGDHLNAMRQFHYRENNKQKRRATTKNKEKVQKTPKKRKTEPLLEPTTKKGKTMNDEISSSDESSSESEDSESDEASSDSETTASSSSEVSSDSDCD